MSVREYVVEDLPDIKKILKQKFNVKDIVLEPQMKNISINEKIWIQEMPDLKGFAWAKLRGEKVFVKYFFTEKDPRLFNELVHYVEIFADVNNLKQIYVSISPAMAHLETLFLEHAYELVEDPMFGKMFYKQVS